MIQELNHEAEIRKLLALAEEHEENGDVTSVKESLRQAQVGSVTENETPIGPY